MSSTPLSSCGYVGQNKVCVYLPNNPRHNQEYVDQFGVIWKFDGIANVWSDTRKRPIEIADDTTTGLLSADLKRQIMALNENIGSFGVIVNKPYQKSVVGNLQFISNSLDINVVGTNGNVLLNTCGDKLQSVDGDHQLLTFSIKQEFLDKLCFYYPAKTGKDGHKGPKGETGLDGTSDTPKGHKGPKGPSLEKLRTLRGIVYVDDDILEPNSIANVVLKSTDNNPRLEITRSTTPIVTNETAVSLVGSTVTRFMKYNSDLVSDCELDGFGEYTLTRTSDDAMPLDIRLLRTSDDLTTNSTVQLQRLSQLIESVSNYYEELVIKIDAEYATIVKEHIEKIDEIARNNLSELADRLMDCEQRLEAEDWSLSFEKCPTFSPSSAHITSFTPISSIQSESGGQEYLLSL